MSGVREARQALVAGADMSTILAGAEPQALSIDSVVAASRGILARLEGAGPTLQPHLDDPAVTDVLVNGGLGVWVDRGRGLEQVDPGPLADTEEVRRLAVQLAAACGQRLDDAAPIVDGTFPSGTRLHAVLPPLAAEGTFISLRTQRQRALTLDDLERSGTVDRAMRVILEAMMSERANAMISGSTGSGKTTLLSALLGLVPAGERIIIIEESAELRPTHPHVLHLQVRHANVQGAGEVTMSALVRAAMRMRPDRLVLGECRGPEVRDVLGALNTGHEGGWATIHANAATDVPARLVALGALASMSEETVAAQAAASLDAVIHIRRGPGGRRVDHIATLERTGDRLSSVIAYAQGRPGPSYDSLMTRLGLA